MRLFLKCVAYMANCWVRPLKQSGTNTLFFFGKFLAVALFIFGFKVWPEKIVKLHKCRPHATHTPQGGNPIRRYKAEGGGVKYSTN
jgi:hypothetical protein